MKFTGKISGNAKALKKLNEELAKSGKVTVRVGVLAGKTDRQEGEFNNAELGAVHEMGSKTGMIPSRSFLRTPCLEDLPEELKKSGPKKLARMIAQKGMVEAMKTVGVLAENSVDHAFETRGKGRWAPNAPATVRKKGSDSPLIDQGKLRRSVTSKVHLGSKSA